MTTRAWRVWQLRPDGMLAGMFNQEWPVNGIMQAECMGGRCKSIRTEEGTYDDPVPHDIIERDKPLFPFHPCGIYVMRDVEIAFDKARGNTGLLTAIGEVDCFGRILPHEQGFRVAQARIRNVAVFNQEWYLAVDGEEFPALQYWTPFGSIWGVTGKSNKTTYNIDAMQCRWQHLAAGSELTAKKYGCDAISIEVLERVENHEIHTDEVARND